MIFYVTGFYRAQYSKMHAKQDYTLYEPILNLPRVDLLQLSRTRKQTINKTHTYCKTSKKNPKQPDLKVKHKLML